MNNNTGYRSEIAKFFDGSYVVLVESFIYKNEKTETLKRQMFLFNPNMPCVPQMTENNDMQKFYMFAKESYEGYLKFEKSQNEKIDTVDPKHEILYLVKNNYMGTGRPYDPLYD